MPETLHAPVPAADCGITPASPLDVLPPDEYDVVQLDKRDPSVDTLPQLELFLVEVGLPVGRLILREGLHVLTGQRTGRRWLSVDYMVPGTRTAPGLFGGGWDVQLNKEVGRAAEGEDGADEAALDRWFSELGDTPIPDHLMELSAARLAARQALQDAQRAAAESHAEHARRVYDAQRELARIVSEETAAP